MLSTSTTVEQLATFWVRIYMSGPIEMAKHVLRKNCARAGCCFTIEPTTFIYTGGEEHGFVVGLINYPRFPWTEDYVVERAYDVAHELLCELHQRSALIQTPTLTYLRRPDDVQ